MKRTISFMTGKGSVNHNSRKFHAKNTDPERSCLNVEYCNENIKDVYHELFDEALARYNEKQTRSDRRIDDYYGKICSGKQEKPFHEIILQIGDKDNMGAKTENGQLAVKVLDKYMQDFQQRNPTLRVFSAYLHMDEATPHLHIDFVPYTTGSKRGLDTRVSLKQALSALGFKGGARRETELNQWVAYEKEQLAAVMLEHGIEWEKKGTHEKHLSVLDFEKKERAKEVAELETKKAELQEENATFQEINEDLHEQLLQVDDEIRSLQEDLQESRQEAEKAQKQADKYQKRMNELAPMVKNMEKLAADFSADPEQTLPEAAVMESAKSYREKKAKPLVKKIVQVMRSVYSAYLDISNKFTKLQAAYNRERSGIRFNTIYTKILKSLGKSRVIVLTHVKKGDWNTEPHNPYWIYLNGHNHQNFYEVSDRRTIYADNQIGYRTKNIGLKYFYCDNNYDIFAYYQDGIHEITREQYIDFNRGKLVSMSFKREDGTIYMLKRNSIYLFLIYCEYSKRSRGKSLYLMNGGKLGRLGRNRIEDLAYYYDNLKKYVENVNQLLYRYVGGQQRISEFIKHLGGSGKIHGCIVDVERPNELEGFSYCHLFVNPIDGKVTPYFAYDVKSRIVYKDFKALLQAHDSCKLMANNYLRLEKESVHNLPTIQYSGQMEEWENEDSMYDEGGYLYKISRIIKSLQYCAEKNIVRLWNEELLNYDFVNRIKQSNKIDEIVDDRLMIDEKSI